MQCGSTGRTLLPLLAGKQLKNATIYQVFHLLLRSLVYPPLISQCKRYKCAFSFSKYPKVHRIQHHNSTKGSNPNPLTKLLLLHFFTLNSVWQSKPATLSPGKRVLAGTVVQTAPLFRTTELSSIKRLVKVSVRNYDISQAAEGAPWKGWVGWWRGFPLGRRISTQSSGSVDG